MDGGRRPPGAKHAMPGQRCRGGRLSAAPSEGVKSRNLPGGRCVYGAPPGGCARQVRGSAPNPWRAPGTCRVRRGGATARVSGPRTAIRRGRASANYRGTRSREPRAGRGGVRRALSGWPLLPLRTARQTTARSRLVSAQPGPVGGRNSDGQAELAAPAQASDRHHCRAEKLRGPGRSGARHEQANASRRTGTGGRRPADSSAERRPVGERNRGGQADSSRRAPANGCGQLRRTAAGRRPKQRRANGACRSGPGKRSLPLPCGKAPRPPAGSRPDTSRRTRPAEPGRTAAALRTAPQDDRRSENETATGRRTCQDTPSWAATALRAVLRAAASVGSGTGTAASRPLVYGSWGLP
ncbi:hypothetical protein SAMN05216259_103366 [Actinacidiphila guanduensis]|uniref:Uncharacterized protein n=1 Tax=Actinacidiphila guanduensis TaxID=310781 RepID=A0A1G9ZZN0_9ACTN|nr:hypothetical protein SAMN05216259_103366 [Actinacidiphila guanduensis]